MTTPNQTEKVGIVGYLALIFACVFFSGALTGWLGPLFFRFFLTEQNPCLRQSRLCNLIA